MSKTDPSTRQAKVPLKPRAAETPGEMAEALAAVGADVRYDVRHMRPVNVTPDGRAEVLDDRSMAAIIGKSRMRCRIHLPSFNGGRGGEVWNWWLAEHSYDAFGVYLDRCMERWPDTDSAFDPGHLPFELWDGRIDVQPAEAELVRWGWRSMFMAAVYRCREAPAKYDILNVWHSKQGGTGKTFTALNLLPEGFASSGLPMVGIDSHDASRKRIEFSAGLVLVESGELGGYSERRVEAVKDDLSRTTDRARMSYARFGEEVPRRTVMVATTNKSEFLPHDTSGYRRFVITSISGKRPNDGQHQEDYLAEWRDRYWAWAGHHYEAGQARQHLSLPAHLGHPQHELCSRFVIRPETREAWGR